ncbi:hypothetical protein HS7_00760 [Sulfolobales archaeon HS-7]|nr:hypothetical protein HS7_00760 [Sulfolobales archaeon HS-7]
MANVDYGKSIMMNTKIPIEDVVMLLEKLESMGLIERVMGSALKNTKAKFKLSPEVHKHHTYYTLTRKGDIILRELQHKGIDAYVEIVKEKPEYARYLTLAKELNADHALTYAKLLHRPLETVIKEIEELVSLGLMEEKKQKIIKFGERKSKPKKETRTHHKYYGLSRTGELVVRKINGKN